MTQLPEPLTRQDMQRMTRERLVFTARAVFARDGFHRASLDEIAKDAGFSKGAIYSNFGNKAELFLAVMDANIVASLDDPGQAEPMGTLLEEHPEFDEAIRGFSLATLEFIAMAARDEYLAAETGKRVMLLVEGYAEVARRAGVEDSDVAALQLGALLTALDQGSAVLSLAAGGVLTDSSLEAGMRALLTLGRRDAHVADVRITDVRRNVAENLGPAYLEQLQREE